MNKLPISVMIIAHNEENNIARALESVASWSDEIVAVINDCSDKTEVILKNYNAKVYERSWSGFVDQKNYALSLCKNEWVFSIDADEEVTPKMQREIELVVLNNSGVQGISFCRKTWFLGRWIKHGDWYPDRVIRLFRKSCSHFEGNYVHERLIVVGEINKSNANLLHYSFPNLFIFLNKLITFSRDFAIGNAHKKSPVAGIIFRSFWKFFRCYIIKRGFLDGFPGLLIAIHQGYSTFFKYSVLKEGYLNKELPFLEKEDQ